MENLFLIKPTTDLEKEYTEMFADWKANDKSQIPWYINIDKIGFTALVKKLEDLSFGIGVEDGFVENSTYWLANDARKIIGATRPKWELSPD